MPHLLLNTIALDPNRWTPEKVAYFDLVDLLPALAEAGFDALEVWQYHLSRLADEQVAALGERARSLGVTFPVVGLYPALHLDGEERAREWAAMEMLVARSADLGARVVKMFAGRLGSDEVDEEAFERSVGFAREMAEAVAEHGLVLTAETHPDTLCDSVPATRRFLAAVDADVIRGRLPAMRTDHVPVGRDHHERRPHPGAGSRLRPGHPPRKGRLRRQARTGVAVGT